MKGLRSYQEAFMISSLSQLDRTTAECSQPGEVRRLTEADRAETRRLLSADPVQTVHLQSLIEDYGFDSPALRGHFFGYFAAGQLAGVALIGHQVMIYAPDAALPLFADAAAQSEVKINLVFGPAAQVAVFAAALGERGR
jgi:hypothetical protein